MRLGKTGRKLMKRKRTKSKRIKNSMKPNLKQQGKRDCWRFTLRSIIRKRIKKMKKID